MDENSDKSPNPTKIGKKKPRGKPFKRGAPSPNPDGRPKKDFDLVTRCKELTPAIIERYAIMGATATTAAEVSAGKVVIAYAEGLPRQRTEITGLDGEPLKITYDHVREKLGRLAKELAEEREKKEDAEDEADGDDDGPPPDQD